MTGEIVPFGKYKGQPVETLIADQDYRDWLMGQDWFRNRFTTIYQTVINYGAEPQDTPEHNEMQASFLDDDRCLRLANLLFPSHSLDREAACAAATRTQNVAKWCELFRDHIQGEFDDPEVQQRSFEVKGWDVVYQIVPSALTIHVGSLPECSCGQCDHSYCDKVYRCRGGDSSRICRHEDHAENRELPSRPYSGRYWYGYQNHCGDKCPWRDPDQAMWLLRSPDYRVYAPNLASVFVECKPQLGDDFPTVLRQVKNYDYEGRKSRRCVVVRNASFEKVTWEQVVEIFKASNIRIVLEADIDQHRDA